MHFYYLLITFMHKKVFFSLHCTFGQIGTALHCILNILRSHCHLRKTWTVSLSPGLFLFTWHILHKSSFNQICDKHFRLSWNSIRILKYNRCVILYLCENYLQNWFNRFIDPFWIVLTCAQFNMFFIFLDAMKHGLPFNHQNWVCSGF